jgi:hypothetical protein
VGEMTFFCLLLVVPHICSIDVGFYTPGAEVWERVACLGDMGEAGPRLQMGKGRPARQRES